MEKQNTTKTILIVEDDVEIKKLLSEFLKIDGYHVFQASNGQEGLSILNSIPTPCVILLDLMMPIMDGREFLKCQSQDIKIAPIPVVILTALEPEERGVSNDLKVVKKPIEIQTLLEVVHQYCNTTHSLNNTPTTNC